MHTNVYEAEYAVLTAPLAFDEDAPSSPEAATIVTPNINAENYNQIKCIWSID